MQNKIREFGITDNKLSLTNLIGLILMLSGLVLIVLSFGLSWILGILVVLLSIPLAFQKTFALIDTQKEEITKETRVLGIKIGESINLRGAEAVLINEPSKGIAESFNLGKSTYLAGLEEISKAVGMGNNWSVKLIYQNDKSVTLYRGNKHKAAELVNDILSFPENKIPVFFNGRKGFKEVTVGPLYAGEFLANN